MLNKRVGLLLALLTGAFLIFALIFRFGQATETNSGSVINFRPGLTESQQNSIINLVNSGRSFSETDAKNYAYSIGESNWQQFVGKTGNQIVTGGTSSPTTTTQVSNAPFTLPAGFVVNVFAKGLQNPRDLIFDPNGTILVSVQKQGRILALPDRNNNGVADRNVVLATGLTNPHGLALRCPETNVCELYVAETTRLSVYNYDATNLRVSNKRKLLDLPSGGRHVTRSLEFIQENNQDVLLISIGSSCDTCRERDNRRGSVISYNLGTKESEIYATGLRNAVFLATHPVSGEVWVTEMGRDFLGNDLPPDEVNILRRGKNYGWPICYGKNIHDTVFDKNTYIRNPCMEPFETESYIDIPAHSAPLGLAFVPASGFPAEYSGDLFVAYHGSWNRTPATGYKIVRMKLGQTGNYESTEDFMTGFRSQNGRVTGRPADILINDAGVMYVSDDYAGNIFRIVNRK